jgi:hypothetical protein
MADVQESYPTPTTGTGKPLFMKLSGTNVTNANPETASGALVGGNNTYKVTLSIANSVKAAASATVSVTVNLYDLAGTSQAIVGSVTAVSYNAAPTTYSGTQESYPTPNATVGDVATVGTVSYSASAGSATITPVNAGQAVVEFEYPFGVGAYNTSLVETGPLPGGALGYQQNDMLYSQILVQVVP